MNLFSREKKILAAQTGKVVKLSDVSDAVFSEKILGDGIAIIPTESQVLAPISGTIAQIAHTYHAIGITGDNGIDILIHLGIDTVKLGGEGFTAFIEEGQHVEAGQKLIDMDINFIKSSGYDPITPCIITNMDEIKEMSVKVNENSTAGVTEVIAYKR